MDPKALKLISDSACGFGRSGSKGMTKVKHAVLARHARRAKGINRSNSIGLDRPTPLRRTEFQDAKRLEKKAMDQKRHWAEWKCGAGGPRPGLAGERGGTLSGGAGGH